MNFSTKPLCINGFQFRFVIYIPFYLWFLFHPKCILHVQEEKAMFSLLILNISLQYMKVILRILLCIISIPQVGYMGGKCRKVISPMVHQGFPDGAGGKESACNVGDLGLIPGLERSPGGGNSNPLQYSCLENSVDRGYSQWDRKESDMTGQLTLSLTCTLQHWLPGNLSIKWCV